MSNRFTRAMSDRTDEELVAIVSGPEDDWEPEALEAAAAEVARRNLSATRVEKVVKRIEKSSRKAKEPLDQGGKLLALMSGATCIGGVVVLIYYATLMKRGERRKAAEVGTWFGYGVAIGLVALVVFLAARGL